MAATEDIVAAFGGMEEMSNGLLNNDVTVIGKMLTILINAGIEYCEVMGQEHPKKPKGRITALLSIQEMSELVSEITAIMTEDAERTVEVNSKN